ncbi:MAG: hypothetical protein AAFY00_13830 [Bacteroidota bacterium]
MARVQYNLEFKFLFSSHDSIIVGSKEEYDEIMARKEEFKF